MKRATLTAAVLALPAAAIAQTPRCIPQDQAAALVTFALPTLVTGLAQRCAPVLPANAYLVVNARVLADRYRPDADAAWPVARRAIAGLVEQLLHQPMTDEMNSDAVRMLAEPLLGGLLAKQISTDDCRTADMAVASVAPLPGRNVGRLAALAAAIADRKGAEDGKRGLAGVLHICKAAVTRPPESRDDRPYDR